MPVPKRKRSRARRDKRFANKGVQIKAMTTCSSCQASVAPHQTCFACGHYKGIKVMTTKLDRAVKRGEAKQARAQKAQAVSSEPADDKQ